MNKIVLLHCWSLIIGYSFCTQAQESPFALDSPPTNQTSILLDSSYTFEITTASIGENNCDTAVFIEWQAHQNIQKGSIYLLISKEENALSSLDSIIQNEFDFKYSYFDQIYWFAPDNNYCDSPDLYNLQVFSYLDHKYGISWRQKIRKDIYGYKLIPSSDELLPSKLYTDNSEYYKYLSIARKHRDW